MPSTSSPQLTPQKRLQQISSKKNYNLNKIPKTFHELLSFMDNNIRKQFRSFSLLAICGGAQKSRFIIQQNFQKSFRLLTVGEKLDFYEKAVDYGMKIFTNQNGQQNYREYVEQELQKQAQNLFLQKPFLQFYITIHQGFRSSQQIKIKIQKFKISSKNHLNLNLQNYILRKSKKKNPQCYILEVINKTIPEHIRFSFTDQQEEKKYLPVIQKIVQIAFKKSIVAMLIPQRKQSGKGYEKGEKGMINNNSLVPIGNRQSIGRLKIPELKNLQSNNGLDQKQQQSNFNIEQTSKGLLQFSRSLVQKQKLNEQPYGQTSYNNKFNNKKPSSNIKPASKISAQNLLQTSTKSIPIVSRQQLSPNKNGIQQFQQENIYSNVLKNQNYIKQPLFNSGEQEKFGIQNKKGDKGKLKLISKKANDLLNVNNKNHNNQLQSPINKFTISQVQSQQQNPNKKPPIQNPKHLYKNVFQIMLPNFNLRQFQPSINSKIFKQIYISSTNSPNNFTIYQHIQNKQRFKCQFFISLYQATLQKIYTLLINQQLLKKWNTQIDQSQIKITLTQQNCLICYQKHKRYNTWFKQRDYLFLRHAFSYKNCKYIVDRSIQHSSFIPFQSIQRGYVKHSVVRLRETKQNYVEVIVDLWMDHCGYLGTEKKKQLNLIYLKQYENFAQYVKTVSKNMQTVEKLKYCNQNWNIDWIDTQDGSFPRALSLKTQEFNQGSQIDFTQNNFCNNADLESQEFYSIKDEFDAQDEFNTNNATIKQSELIKNNNKAFQKKQPLKQNVSQVQDYQHPQLQQQEHNILQKSIYDQKNKLIQAPTGQIDLDTQGYCILPQKYIKKHHQTSPQNKQNSKGQRIKKYDNIVLKGDFVVDKQQGLLLVNKKKIQSQNNVIGFIMKTFRKNLFSGKSMLSISLPVQIFKQDSNTQRLAQSMGLGPYFLQKAFKQTDLVQRFKWCVCFGLSNSILYFYIEKPFNPILGQTYQGVIDGCPIYAEQISHHPPISSIYFVGRGYKVYANLQAKVYLHLNSGDGVNFGFYTIEFDDGQIVKFQTGPGEVSGITVGDRKFNFKDRLYVVDPKNLIYCELLFQDPNSGFFSKGKWKFPDQMQGEILKVTPSFMKKFMQAVQSKQKPHPKPKQIQQSVSKMQGRWASHLNFDGKLYYNIQQDIPYNMKNYKYPLNSDARYRQDLIYRTKNDLAKSQIFKEYLQNKQRKDRKFRQQYSGKTSH